MTEKIEVILVDIGSSTIKSAEVIGGETTNHTKWDRIEDLKRHYENQTFAISSVRKNNYVLRQSFSGKKDIVVDHTVNLPITLDYQTPETLGPDRIALSVGAHYLFPNQNNLIIDLGTCMTMDLVDKSGRFQGGIISPGLHTRMKSMADYTQSLPDISEEWQQIPYNGLGKTTKQSLLNGSYFGLLNEINASIETISNDFASINIILTGGDAKFFESRLKAHIFAGSKIVEIGLYRIWLHQ